MIWGRFAVQIPSKIGLGRPLGAKAGFGGPKTSEALVLESQVAAALGLSRLLAASWSLKKRLEASRGGLEPIFPSQVPSLFRTSFCIDVGPQNDSKIYQKSTKKIDSKKASRK